ncbi:hypothetical protein GGP43_003073 [Salinibacter ruber]|nr:hypothetical protein [Salinibacter ruber]
MLISDSYEFIFVHNYKVAGSSIKHALKSYAQKESERLGWVQRQCARLRLREIPHYPAHLTAREIRNDHPEEWRRYFTFGIVQNPWGGRSCFTSSCLRSHRDYRTHYSDRSRELVAEHFQEDVERFGYCFDGVRDQAAIVT